MASYTSTSKFINILPYVLMEYQYTTLPTIEEYPVNFGPTTVGFEKIANGYYNNVQILNSLADVDITGNTRQRSAVQIADSTFVDLDINYFTQYLDFDSKLTPTSDIPVYFPSNILVQYDTIRFHFLSGYNFPDTDGVIFQVRYKENSGIKSVVAQIVVEKNNTDSVILNPDRIYYNGSIFDKYVEIKVPALANMCAAFDTESGSPAQAQTLAALISSNGGGFATGSPFNITSYEIATTKQVNGYYTYIANQVNTAVLNPFDEYAYLAANLVENTLLNYWEYYPTWQGEFIDQFIFTENSLGNIYYIINEVIVSEQIGLSLIETSRFQTIQTSGFDAPLIFRPIVTNSRATSFTIDYNVSLVNKVNNTSILRRASVTSMSVALYGAGMNRIQLRNDPYPLKVYNKVIESAKITSAYSINVNPINSIVTKYVPAFFETESINIAEQDLTITNIGSTSQTSTLDSTTAFGQGKLQIIVNPFDNYYKFKIFNSNTGAENTVLDLGNNSSYYLVFTGDNGNKVKIASLTDATFQNPNKGELGFRVVEADSKNIQTFSNRDFHITALSPNGIETSVYYGTWLLPSERSLKNSGSSGTGGIGTSGSAGTSGKIIPKINITPGVRVEAIANNSLATANVNILTSDIKTSFDTKKDSIFKNIAPVSLINSITSNTPTATTSGATPTIDMVALANAILGDETLGKSYKDIADYYTIPGRPGYNTYKGITKQIFLNAVKRIYPDVDGSHQDQYIAYANYLGLGGGRIGPV